MAATFGCSSSSVRRGSPDLAETLDPVFGAGLPTSPKRSTSGSCFLHAGFWTKRRRLGDYREPNQPAAGLQRPQQTLLSGCLK
jgi:hypothetical protein